MTDDELLTSLTGFTPGPYYVDGPNVYADSFNANVGGGGTSYDELESTARLFGVAPDIYRIALERGAEIARLHKALDNIGELNLLPRDENGHKWWNSDLIGQEVMAARAPSKAEP